MAFLHASQLPELVLDALALLADLLVVLALPVELTNVSRLWKRACRASRSEVRYLNLVYGLSQDSALVARVSYI